MFKPPLAGSNYRPQSPTSRPMGNAQSRTSAMPRSPAYGNTTNVNGSQTAAGGVAPAGLFTMNPNNVYRSPENIQRRQGIANAVGGLFTANPGGVQRSPESTQRRESIAGFFGAQPAQAAQAVGQSTPQQPAAPAQPAEPQYPGGDVAGIASYYRNSAVQGYQGGNQMVPNSPLQSSAVPPVSPVAALDEIQTAIGLDYTIDQLDSQIRQSQVDNPRLPNSPMAGVLDPDAIADARMAPAAAREAARQQNTPANGLVEAMNDPNRYNPMDPKTQAIQRRNAADQTAGRPVGRDNRWSSGAMDDYTESGGKPWHEREAEAARNSPEMQAKREAAYQSAMASSGPKNASVRAKYDDPALKARQSAFSQQKADKAKAFQAENGGLNYKQMDRLTDQQLRLERMVTKGVISRSEADLRMGVAKDKALRRASAMSGGSGGQAPDRVRLPDGELPQATRTKAKETAVNMTNPDFKGGTPEFQQEAEIVRSLGLTADQSAAGAAESIARSPFPIDNPEGALRTASALRRFWGSMRDTDSKWDSNTGPFETDSTDPVLINMMKELAETPEDQIQSWIDKYSGHLASFGQQQGSESSVDINGGFGM